MKTDLYTKDCPTCERKMYYSNKYILKYSLAKGTSCISCFNKSRTGRAFTPNHKLQLSKSQIKRYADKKQREITSLLVKKAMQRPDVRKRHIDALHKTKWLVVRTDKGQLEMIEKWNHLGFKFEPNYQVHTDMDLFYIDGYDKEHNVVLEYDTKYHYRPHQQRLDLLRQSKIIEILKPKRFWRYDSVNKTFINVVGEQ